MDEEEDEDDDGFVVPGYRGRREKGRWWRSEKEHCTVQTVEGGCGVGEEWGDYYLIDNDESHYEEPAQKDSRAWKEYNR